jgi:CcmD family protein
MSPLGWMFVGYSAMWAAIVLYVANLGRRQAAAERELAALREAVEAEARAASAVVGMEAERERPAPPAR